MTKQPPWLEVSGSVAEALDLRVLRGQVRDGVEHQVGEAEGAVDPRAGHVADGDLDPVGARLGPQLVGHRRGQLDAGHRHAPTAQRQGQAPGADGQLERAARPGQVGEEVHRRVDH